MFPLKNVILKKQKKRKGRFAVASFEPRHPTNREVTLLYCACVSYFFFFCSCVEGCAISIMIMFMVKKNSVIWMATFGERYVGKTINLRNTEQNAMRFFLSFNYRFFLRSALVRNRETIILPSPSTKLEENRRTGEGVSPSLSPQRVASPEPAVEGYLPRYLVVSHETVCAAYRRLWR